MIQSADRTALAVLVDYGPNAIEERALEGVPVVVIGRQERLHGATLVACAGMK